MFALKIRQLYSYIYITNIDKFFLKIMSSSIKRNVHKPTQYRYIENDF